MDDDTTDGFTTPSLYGRPETPKARASAPPPSRRGFLVGGGVVVAVAAGGGVALGLASGSDKPAKLGPREPHVSQELAAAATSERALIATVDAAVAGAHGSTKRVLQAIRGDHAAHLAAIEAAISDDAYPATVSSSASTSAPASAPPPKNVRNADVRKGEARAARAAAARALRLTGRDAVLFASIAASEAAHAEVLT
jgi:hypothetical protein